MESEIQTQAARPDKDACLAKLPGQTEAHGPDKHISKEVNKKGDKCHCNLFMYNDLLSVSNLVDGIGTVDSMYITLY